MRRRRLNYISNNDVYFLTRRPPIKDGLDNPAKLRMCLDSITFLKYDKPNEFHLDDIAILLQEMYDILNLSVVSIMDE